MRFFEIQVTETLQATFSIQGETEEEALEQARREYRESEMALDADNSNVYAVFKVEDDRIPPVIDRYELLQKYMNNQTDDNWYKLLSKIEELQYGD